MKITDKNVKKWLKAIDCEELTEMVESYPEDELDGRSEIQVFTDELSYAISNYNEDGHCWHDDLLQARALLRETENGRRIPVDLETFKPRRGYMPYDIESAKHTVNEYKRMVYRYNQLKKAGYFGRWY